MSSRSKRPRQRSATLVAPSAVRAVGQMWTDALGMQDIEMPRALESHEIPGVIEQYAQATPLRPVFKGPFVAGGGFTKESGDAALRSGAADFIVFGKLFTSNPDLPARFAKGAALVPPDAGTFYSPGPKGYVDYAFL